MIDIKSITDAEHYIMQKVVGLKRFGVPATVEQLEEAKPLIEKGWIIQNGHDLSIPDEAMWELLAIGKQLKTR